MSETTTIERYADALGDVVLASLALFVLFGQDWLITNGLETVSTVLGILLVVLAGVALIPDVLE